MYSPGWAQEAEQEKPATPGGRGVTWELRGADNQKEVWLYRRENKADAQKLCDTAGSGYTRVWFAPDHRWIIVEDGGASLGITLRIFRQVKQMEFKEVEEAAIDDKAEKLALSQAGAQGAGLILDHRYLRLMHWSGDARTILVEFSGKGGNQQHNVSVEGWFGLFDLNTLQFIPDLNQVNTGAVKMSGSQ